MKTLAAALLLISSALAQSQPASKKGILYAPDYAFGNGQVAPLVISAGNSATGSQTVTILNPVVTLQDGRRVMPLSTNVPLLVDAGSNQETVTPSAISGCSLGSQPSSCQITATFSHVHPAGTIIASGDSGSQEALNDATALGNIAFVIDSTGKSIGGSSGLVTPSGSYNWTGAQTFHSTGTNDYIWYLQALDNNAGMGWGVSQTGMPWTFWNHDAVWGNSTNASAFHIIQERTGLFVYDSVEGESRMEEASTAGSEFAIDNIAATHQMTAYYIPNFKDDPVVFYPGEVRFSNSSGGPFGGFGPTENLVEFSEDFTNAVWVPTNVTVTGNSTTSPDNTSDADTIVASAGSPNTLWQDVSANTSANSTYTFSVWLKSGVAGTTTVFPGCNDNVSGIFSQQINVNNQWQQVEVTCTFGAGSTTRQVGFNLVGTSFYAWGGQLSTGSDPNQYAKTTNAVLTKSLQPFSLRDGSLSAPAFGFATEPQLGFYRQRANDIQFTQGGGRTFEIDAANGWAAIPTGFGYAWGTNTAEDTTLTRPAAGIVKSNGALQTSATTFATLPACNGTNEGMMRAITDSATATWGATITGSSTNHVLAYCDGTGWTVAAK